MGSRLRGSDGFKTFYDSIKKYQKKTPVSQSLRVRLRIEAVAGRAETRSPAADSDRRRVFIGQGLDAQAS